MDPEVVQVFSFLLKLLPKEDRHSRLKSLGAAR